MSATFILGLETPPEEAAKAFLELAEQYSLGHLPTEAQHPQTLELSKLANTAPKAAVQLLQDVDKAALKNLQNKIPEIMAMRNAVQATLKQSRRVFLCGCGAPGRLSLSVEVLWRQQASSEEKDSVIGFMAGGDIALIRSIEDFEDSPEFGAQQLKELGFEPGDLLITSTEGGETPYMIGATEYAASLVQQPGSRAQKPYFLYCNPDDILSQTIERSRKVIENNSIHKINLTCGPMALSGSTRMQATTLLMAAIGAAVLEDDAQKTIEEIDRFINETNLDFLTPYIEKESDLIKNNGTIYYEASQNLAIAVLTDTTERSPTFSLAPFDNRLDSSALSSLSYLYLPEAKNCEDGWEKLLYRKPRTLNWEKYRTRVGIERLLGYDFSKNVLSLRKEQYPHLHPSIFRINDSGDSLELEFEELRHKIPWKNASNLTRHLLLKVILNIHSTILMGRLGRYESNMMVWVKPSNLKLIDRAIRYTLSLLNQQGITYTYEDVTYECFRQRKLISETDSIVLKTVEALKAKR